MPSSYDNHVANFEICKAIIVERLHALAERIERQPVYTNGLDFPYTRAAGYLTRDISLTVANLSLDQFIYWGARADHAALEAKPDAS